MAVPLARQRPQSGIARARGAHRRGAGAHRHVAAERTRKIPAADHRKAPRRLRQRPAVDVQSVVSAHLFGVATADPSTQDPANAPLSSANLVLAGTIATQDPEARHRHHQRRRAPSKVFSVGENVNGAALAFGLPRPRHPRPRRHFGDSAAAAQLPPRGPQPGLVPRGSAPTRAPWRPSTTFAAWCSRIRGSWIRSCARCLL